MKKKLYINLIFIILVIFWIYKSYYLNMSFFVKDNTLNLKELKLNESNLGDIINYSKNNQIKILDLRWNNFKDLNNLLYEWNYNFNQLYLWSISDHTSGNNNNYSNIIDLFELLNTKYGKISFLECSNTDIKCIWSAVKIIDLDSNSINLQLYKLIRTKLWLNSINFDFNNSSSTPRNEKDFLDILKDYNNTINNIYNINISNPFNNKDYLKYIKYFKELDYKNISFKFTWPNSEYLQKYFDIKDSKVNKISYKDKFIKSDFINELILNYNNLKTLELNNISSDKEIVIDLSKTNIKNYNFIWTNSSIILPKKNEEHNLLLDNYSFPEWINANTLDNNTIYWHHKFNDNLNELLKYNIGNYELLNELYTKYYDDIFIHKNLSEINFERIWFKYKTIWDELNDYYISNKDIENLINESKLLFNKKVSLNNTIDNNEILNEKQIFKNNLDIIFKSSSFRVFLKDYHIYLNYYKIYNDNFESNIDKSEILNYNGNLTTNNNVILDFNILEYKEIFKIGNTYIFIKK